MSFLQINNTNPSEKRPFRLSDIQDIWDGITSLFKPIKGEQFRIISGFNIEGTTYSAGAVYYNDKIYEYDGSKPITTSTSTTYFAKIAVDSRQFEGGNSYPFAYKYVCGGSSFASESGYVTQVSFTYFRTNIPKYKSYLGVGSVTTDKIADASITRNKLAPNLAPIVADNSRIEVSANSTYNVEDLIANGKVKTIVATNTSGTVVVQIEVRVPSSSYDTLPSLIYIPVATQASASINVQLKAADNTVKAYSLGSDDARVIVLALANLGTTGMMYTPAFP